jgi:hypothetical protein
MGSASRPRKRWLLGDQHRLRQRSRRPCPRHSLGHAYLSGVRRVYKASKLVETNVMKTIYEEISVVKRVPLARSAYALAADMAKAPREPV